VKKPMAAMAVIPATAETRRSKRFCVVMPYILSVLPAK
jgi:hypothetical protein